MCTSLTSMFLISAIQTDYINSCRQTQLFIFLTFVYRDIVNIFTFKEETSSPVYIAQLLCQYTNVNGHSVVKEKNLPPVVLIERYHDDEIPCRAVWPTHFIVSKDDVGFRVHSGHWLEKKKTFVLRVHWGSLTFIKVKVAEGRGCISTQSITVNTRVRSFYPCALYRYLQIIKTSLSH